MASNTGESDRKTVRPVNLADFEPEVVAGLFDSDESNSDDTEDDANPCYSQSLYSEASSQDSRISKASLKYDFIDAGNIERKKESGFSSIEDSGESKMSFDQDSSVSEVLGCATESADFAGADCAKNPIGNKKSVTIGEIAKDLLGEADKAKTTPAAMRKMRQAKKPVDQINLVKQEIQSTKNEIAKLQEMMGKISDLRSMLLREPTSLGDVRELDIEDLEEFKTILSALPSDGAGISNAGGASKFPTKLEPRGSP